MIKGIYYGIPVSAQDEQIYYPPVYNDQQTSFDLITMKDKDFFVYDIDLRMSDGNTELPLCFVTLQPADTFYALRHAFNQSMILWQLLAIIGSLAVLYIAMRVDTDANESTGCQFEQCGSGKTKSSGK